LELTFNMKAGRGRAARRRHDNPAALGLDHVADVVVREIVATRLSHREVVATATADAN
jgi:hypothetical protein